MRAIVSSRNGRPACIRYTRNFGCRINTSSISAGLPRLMRNFGQHSNGVFADAIPVWNPTGTSSSSARARYGSSDGSFGAKPMYCPPISDDTNPALHDVTSQHRDGSSRDALIDLHAADDSTPSRIPPTLDRLPITESHCSNDVVAAHLRKRSVQQRLIGEGG